MEDKLTLKAKLYIKLFQNSVGLKLTFTLKYSNLMAFGLEAFVSHVQLQMGQGIQE